VKLPWCVYIVRSLCYMAVSACTLSGVGGAIICQSLLQKRYAIGGQLQISRHHSQALHMYSGLVSPAKGSSEIVRLEPRPLQPNSVRARVLYGSMNPIDGKVLFVLGNIFNLPEPMQLGFDFSGVVTETNSDEFKVGDHVFGGASDGGGFSQELVTSTDSLAKYDPKVLPDKEASTYGVAYLSACEPLLFVVDLKQYKGKWIYIPGGSGGVGHFAVQIAKHYGLNVITSASKPQGLEYLRGLGLAAVIDYRNQDVVEEIMKLTDRKGVDLVYDSTYVSSSMRQSVLVVKTGGTWLRLGSLDLDGPEEKAAVENIAAERGATATYGDHGRYRTDPEYISRVTQFKKVLLDAVELYRTGAIRPWITKTIPFEDKAVKEALSDSVNGKLVGKAVVEMSKQ